MIVLHAIVAVFGLFVPRTCTVFGDITNLSNTSGVISHWFSVRYNNDLDLEWRLDLPTLMGFILKINKLWLEESVTCKADKLIIWFGEDSQRFMGPFCGRIADAGGHENSFMDYGFRVQFHTDSSVRLYGFKLTYTSFRPETKQICDMMHNVDSREIGTKVLGKSDKYPLELNCTWNIDSTDYGFLRFHVKDFDIEFSGDECIYDNLEIWEISEEESDKGHKKLGRFCGRRYSWTVFVYSKKARITFVSDHADNARGFLISYSEYTDLSYREIRLEPIKVTLNLVRTIFPAQWVILEHSCSIVQHFRTNPGFYIRVDFNDTITDPNLVAYDGPDSMFAIMQLYGRRSVNSNGFHLVLQTVIFNQTSSVFWELSVRAVKAFTQENTIVNYIDFGSVHRYVVHEPSHPCCMYLKEIGPTFKTLKLLYLTDFDQLARSPNIDTCAYYGIAIFDGEVTLENMVGPFCDLLQRYTKAILENFISTSSIVHVVLYDYRMDESNRWDYNSIEFISSSCEGYNLINPAAGKLFQGDKFSVKTRITNGTKIVELWYVEHSDDCVIINILPQAASTIDRLQIHSPSGNFNYRLCRQFGPLQSLPSAETRVSKFDLESSCGYSRHTGQGHILFDEGFVENMSWTTEYLRLELGGVDENTCHVINRCPENQILNLNIDCSFIEYIYPECTWLLMPRHEQRNNDPRWVMEIRFLSGSSSPPYGYLEIEEYVLSHGWSMKTHLSPNEMGYMRIFRYRALPAQFIYIRPAYIEYIKVQFRITSNNLYRPPSMAEVNIGRYAFGDHTYEFVQFSSLTSWTDAMNHCRLSGGYLVSLNTLAELEFIKDSLATVWIRYLYGSNYGIIFIGLSDIGKPDDYRWEDGSPLTVSDWYYPFDSFNNILPVKPKPALDRDKIQPVHDTRLRCVAMNVGNPSFSSNWMKLNCETNHSSPTNAICEYGTTPTVEMRNASVISGQSMWAEFECPDGWVFIRGTCIAILTTDRSLSTSMKAGEAIDLCRWYGGELAVIDQFTQDQIRNCIFSQGLLPGAGDIWVKFNASRIGCISLSLLQDTPGYNHHINMGSTETCVITEGRAAHTMCEREVQSMHLSCPSYLFACNDGTCLSPDSVCNGRDDCATGDDETNCKGLYGTHVCQDGQTISISKYCDFLRDCKDGSDEKNCIHPECLDNSYQCKNSQCISKSQRCDHKRDCIDGSDEESCDWGLFCQGFRCPAVGCLPPSRWQDLQPDCPDASQADEDRSSASHQRYIYFVEENGEMIAQENDNSECPGHSDHQRCHPEHIKCYPRHKSCLYDHDQYGQVRYCRNGAHLRHCEFFECPGLFKCPKSYCIPNHKVCDGNIDCTDGSDEFNCTSQVCPGKFRCGDTSQCLSLEELCDGRVHCQSNWMDELFCDLALFSCPANCTCNGYVITCGDVYRVPDIEISDNVRVLDLDRNDLLMNNFSFVGYPYLTILVLSNNQIEELPSRLFANLANLIYLDLSHNRLQKLVAGTFEGLRNLLTLQLEDNPISFLEKETFNGLSILPRMNLSGLMISELVDNVFYGLEGVKELDLSNNRISKIEQKAFASVPRLDLILLDRNPLDRTSGEIFRSLNVKTMRTDSYRFCCFAGHNVVDCKPDVDIYSSCSDLLANEFVQVVVWILGILAVLGNISVICWRLLVKVNNSPSVFILQLSLSDCMMGAYLICLASIDTLYRGTYILHDAQWRKSGLCHFIGAVATVSCEMSMFILLCIAIDRTRRVVYPFASSQFTIKLAWFTVILGWACFAAIAILPVIIPSYFGNYYGRNAICLPFNFSGTTGEGWEFATVVFVGLNSTALILIFILYAKIYCSVKESQEKAARKDRADLEVARRLSLVIMTNLICILPIIIANILAILGQPVNRDIASVLTTVVLPLNSALNPYLFTFSACHSANTPKNFKTR